MPIEVANTIEQLDVRWPLLGDSMRQTGAHIRQIKSVIKKIFKGVNGNGFNTPILSNESEWNRCAGLTAPIQPQLSAIQSNAILISGVMPYSGLLANIPPNYLVCDGTNGTPNLVNRFIMGTNIQSQIGVVGGSADKIVPAHTHDFSHAHAVTILDAGAHAHTFSIDTTSSGKPTQSIGSASSSGTFSTKRTELSVEHTHRTTAQNATVTTSTDGSVGTDLNLPAYVKLAYIIRMS